jgi:hypothetical protein
VTEAGPRSTTLDWLGVAALALCGGLSALIEMLLVPLYLGKVIFPVTVVLAVVGNVTLPRLARRMVPTTLAAALPLLTWLLMVIGFGTVGRPEGDVILPGAPRAAELVAYALMLVGALAGVATIALTVPPPPSRSPVSR